MSIEYFIELVDIIIVPCIVALIAVLHSHGNRLAILEENRKVQDEQLKILNKLTINVAEMNIKLDNLEGNK